VSKHTGFIVLAAAAGALCGGLAVWAQTVTPPGKFIPSTEWKQQLDADKPSLGIVAGQTATIVPNMVVRRRLDGPNNASVHTLEGDKQDVTEIYHILDGSGTYVTGGTMPDPKNRTAGIKGGEAHDIKPGDFIVIPPGTAHWFSKINDHITYLEVRFPGNVMKK
jgi:mannose-6-phosphate isomerase-like protein (cupin superfamily)